MCIALHPFLTGQPHRIKYLDEILDYIMSHEGVWQTTADEIAEYYLAHHYDQAVAHAAKLHA
jgi:peptidoglycan/xylan/chitin deacetylase (PgdA/CDA1 family)